MHYILEIIIPPVDNIEEAIEEIMKPFYEGDEENTNAFYDFYKIGGRFSGHKLRFMLGTERMDEFYDLLKEEKITVSSFVVGKETLAPNSQAEKVDKLWNDFFPDSPIKQCPVFDNYKPKDNFPDVCSLLETPKDLTCSRVIIAKRDWEDKQWEA